MNQSILKKVLIAGTTSLLVAGGARANYEPPHEGCHFVMVKTPANTQSM